MSVFSFQVTVLLGEFSVGDLESVDFLFKVGLVVSKLSVLSCEFVTSLLEGGVLVLKLSVPLGEVLDDDLYLKTV